MQSKIQYLADDPLTWTPLRFKSCKSTIPPKKRRRNDKILFLTPLGLRSHVSHTYLHKIFGRFEHLTTLCNYLKMVLSSFDDKPMNSHICRATVRGWYDTSLEKTQDNELNFVLSSPLFMPFYLMIWSSNEKYIKTFFT